METEQRAKAFCPVFLLPSIRQKGPVDLFLVLGKKNYVVIDMKRKLVL